MEIGTEAFPDLGRHCSFQMCQQLDFLPFTCDACKQTFCLEHRTFSSHECPRADYKDTKVMICPMCAMTVRHVYGEVADVTVDRHMRDGSCDPSNYAKLTKKKARCPVKGCKQALTFSCKVRCRDCRVEVCLRHRFGEDHACVKASPSLSSMSSRLPTSSLATQPTNGRSGIEGRLLSLALTARSGSDCAVSERQQSLTSNDGNTTGKEQRTSSDGAGREIEAH